MSDRGFVLSSDFFIMYGVISTRVTEEMDGFSIGGRIVIIRYADNSELVAELVEKLQALFDVANSASEESGLKIIREKIDSMVVL